MAKHEAGDRKIPKPGTNITMDGKSYTTTPSDMVLTNNEDPEGGLVYLPVALRHYDFETAD